LAKWQGERRGRLPVPAFWLQPPEEQQAAWRSTDLPGAAAEVLRVGRAGRGAASWEQQAGKLKGTEGLAYSREKPQTRTQQAWCFPRNITGSCVNYVQIRRLLKAAQMESRDSPREAHWAGGYSQTF